jgi:hypothetical protein
VSASTSRLPDPPTVFDTVVINYFLAAGELRLLAGLFGGSLMVPRAVFDPDEEDTGREEGLSELRRGLHLHRRRCEDDGAPPNSGRAPNVPCPSSSRSRSSPAGVCSGWST